MELAAQTVSFELSARPSWRAIRAEKSDEFLRIVAPQLAYCLNISFPRPRRTPDQVGKSGRPFRDHASVQRRFKFGRSLYKCDAVVEESEIVHDGWVVRIAGIGLQKLLARRLVVAA